MHSTPAADITFDMCLLLNWPILELSLKYDCANTYVSYIRP